MVRKSKVITVPKNEETEDEIIEKRFKKLIQETKDEEYKAWLQGIYDILTPVDDSNNLFRTFRRICLNHTLLMCNISSQLKETRIKLKECQERASNTPKLAE